MAKYKFRKKNPQAIKSKIQKWLAEKYIFHTFETFMKTWKNHNTPGLEILEVDG